LIEQHETYPKQTYRNRCRIMTAGGVQTLSVPIIKPSGNHSSIREVYPSQTQPWASLHWKTIVSAYRNSPFFQYYQDDLKPFFHDHTGSLLDLNMRFFNIVLNLMKIKPIHTFTDRFVRNPLEGTDLRNSIHPKHPDNTLIFPSYVQVFSDRFPFTPDLSILDLIFNLGPDSLEYIKQINTK